MSVDFITSVCLNYVCINDTCTVDSLLAEIIE